MTDIVTLTPNPAVDISTSVEKIVPANKLRCTTQLRDPGGGGINVARVVKRLGGGVVALYPIGGATGDLLRRLIEREDVPSRTSSIAEETREDFSVTELSSGQQYRFVLPGPRLNETEWQECLDLVAKVEPFPRFLVASGSLPPGVPDDFYARVSRIAKQRGAKMILDTSGVPLAAAVAEGVDIIKPNLRELGELTGIQLADSAQCKEASRRLVMAGRVSIVALTLGHRGAVLVTRDQILRAQPIPITPVSTVGAGDSFLGAMTWRLAAGHDLRDAFRYAVAAGAAALLNPGTELCRPEDVSRLSAHVVMESV
jgi:6-phosphofructokinase 2